MECKEIQNLLAEMSAGVTTDFQNMEIESHLTQCASCRKEQTVLLATIALVESIEPVEPPYGMWYGIEARIRQTGSEVVKPSPAFWLKRKFAAAAALLAVLVIAFGIYMFNISNSTDSKIFADKNSVANVLAHESYTQNEPFNDEVAAGSLIGVASYDVYGEK